MCLPSRPGGRLQASLGQEQPNPHASCQLCCLIAMGSRLAAAAPAAVGHSSYQEFGGTRGRVSGSSDPGQVRAR